MDKSKLNFFQQIQYAITKPLQYYKLSKVSGLRLTGFVFLFTFIISLFTTVPMCFSAIGPNGFAKYLREDVPAFEMSDGKLNVDGRYENEEAGTYFLVDTSIEKFSTDDVDDVLYDQVILISKTNIVVYQNARTQVISFSELGPLHFDNKILNAFIPFLYVILAIVVIIIYLAMVAGYFFTALLYSVVGLIVSGIIKANLPYARIFKTAIYSKVTASIIITILNVTPANIPGFIMDGIAILITCTYVVYGTMSHNSDAAKEEMAMNIPPQNPNPFM